MVTVQEIIDTRDAEKFNSCKYLRYALYKFVGCGRTVCTNSIQHYKKFQPVVYSDNAQELEEYAKELKLESFDILENPLYKQQ